MSEAIEPTWLCPGCESRVSLWTAGHPLACQEAKRWEALRQLRVRRAGRITRFLCRWVGHSWNDAAPLNCAPWCRHCGEAET